MENIVNLFLNDHGMYARWMQFEVLVLAIFATICITYIFPNNYAYVIILFVFVLYIVQTYLAIKDTGVSDNNKLTMFKLNKLQKAINDSIHQKLTRVNNTKQKLPKSIITQVFENNKLDYLYLDANMIQFLYTLLPLHEMNPDEFYLFIKGINNILELRAQIENFFEQNKEYPQNTSEMFETAIQLKTNTLNNLHNFIYSVPTTNVMYKYIENVLERYNILITRNLDTMHFYYSQNIIKRGIRNSTKFVNFGGTKHFQETDNHTLIAQKNTNKTIQFYV